MSKKIVLGVTADGKPFVIDLVLLLETRLLLSANSGGGKSYTLRQLIEQIFGKVQIILIDREGEFKSLRDKYDFLLVGEGGDIPAHIGSARLLAEKLLESGVDAICDLYEAFRTRPIDRLAWVREFVMGLVDAPKHLWHDVIVIVDEAHIFCPEVAPKGRNMEEREIINGCKDAVVALATVGRKRGQCAVFATQRLAKLDKDASAELLNRMTGVTEEGQDVDRAIDLMSIPKDERASFKKSIRELEPGNLYAKGRAISKEMILVKINQVQTKHHDPRSRKHIDYSPPTPAKIQALLSKFKDLPKEIEAKAKSEADLRKENADLRGQIATLGKQLQAVPKIQTVAKPIIETKVEVKEVAVLQASEIKAVEGILSRMERVRKILDPILDWKKIRERIDPLLDLDGKLSLMVEQIGAKLSSAAGAGERMKKLASIPKAADSMVNARPVVPHRIQAPGLSIPDAMKMVEKEFPQDAGSDSKLNSLQLRQLKGLMEFGAVGIWKVRRRLLAAWLGLSYSGHFQNMFSNLHKRGLLQYEGDLLLLTAPGQSCAPAPELPPTTEKLLENCVKALDTLRERQLRHLHGKYPEWILREELAGALDLSYSGHFQNCFSTLHSAKIVEYGEKRSENHGKLKCADWLFLEHMQYRLQPA